MSLRRLATGLQVRESTLDLLRRPKPQLPPPWSVVTKEHYKVSQGLRGRPGSERAEQHGHSGLTSSSCPLILFQLRFPAHGQLQLLADHLNLPLQLRQLLHH